MSTPDLENVLLQYSHILGKQQAEDARSWAQLTSGAKRFVELFQRGNFQDASDLLEELEDVEYKLTLNCEATTLLGEGCGGYSVEDHGWLFGAEASKAREEERQDDDDMPRTRSWSDVPMRRPVSLWLADNKEFEGIVLRQSMRHLLLFGRRSEDRRGIEYVIKRHEVVVWCPAVASGPQTFFVNSENGSDGFAGYSEATPLRTLQQTAFMLAMLGSDRTPQTLELKNFKPDRDAAKLEALAQRFGTTTTNDFVIWKT